MKLIADIITVSAAPAAQAVEIQNHMQFILVPKVCISRNFTNIMLRRKLFDNGFELIISRKKNL